MIRVFQCEESLTGILTGVYDAWGSRLGHANVRLVAGQEELQLFCEYEEVKADVEKAGKVMRTIVNRMGEDTLRLIAQAAACTEPERADVIYRTIVLGLHLPDGRRVTEMLSRPEIMKLFILSRRAGRLAARYIEFLRFRELQNGVLLGEMDPDGDVLTLIAPHFADRFPMENWMIYDHRRRKTAVHPSGKTWYVVEEVEEKTISELKESEVEAEFSDLWKCFFETIAIEARKNAKLQNQLAPLKYRAYMTEYKNNEGLHFCKK